MHKVQCNDAQQPSEIKERKKIHSKSRGGAVAILLQVDDLEYKHRIQKPTNTSTNVSNALLIKRDMIPALPSRHGSRADLVVPLHSQARFKAEKILSKANEFRILFDEADEDFSVLDQRNACETHKRKETTKKPDGLSHSMEMNVWRANKLNSISPNQTRSRRDDQQKSDTTSHSSPINLYDSFHSESSCEPSSSFKDSMMRDVSNISFDFETVPRDAAQPTQFPKMRVRNDQVSDVLLHKAIMHDVVQALERQSLQPPANPYVSLVDIRFARSTDVDTHSHVSLINNKMCARSGILDPKQMNVTIQGGVITKKSEKRRSKKTKDICCKIHSPSSPDTTEYTINDSRFQLESPFAVQVPVFSNHADDQKPRESPKLPPVKLNAGRTIGTEKRQLQERVCEKMNEWRVQHSPSRTEFELIGLTIASEENAANMESRCALFEAIERNAAERIQICSEINRSCHKLQKQWQAKQKTILCQSNTRLQGSARSQLLTFLRALRGNQTDFFELALRCSAFHGESSGMLSMTGKIASWKQNIQHHMHELVKLPTVADVINEIAIEGHHKSNGFKSSIGTFSGCAKVDLATAAACSKLLLGSKDCKTIGPNDAEFFRISGNNVAPSNGHVSSIMLSPCEPAEVYKQKLLNGLPGVFVQATLTEGIAGSRVMNARLGNAVADQRFRSKMANIAAACGMDGLGSRVDDATQEALA